MNLLDDLNDRIDEIDGALLAIGAEMCQIKTETERNNPEVIAGLMNRLQALQLQVARLPGPPADFSLERERLQQGISYLHRTLQRWKPLPAKTDEPDKGSRPKKQSKETIRDQFLAGNVTGIPWY